MISSLLGALLSRAGVVKTRFGVKTALPSIFQTVGAWLGGGVPFATTWQCEIWKKAQGKNDVILTWSTLAVSRSCRISIWFSSGLAVKLLVGWSLIRWRRALCDYMTMWDLKKAQRKNDVILTWSTLVVRRSCRKSSWCQSGLAAHPPAGWSLIGWRGVLRDYMTMWDLKKVTTQIDANLTWSTLAVSRGHNIVGWCR